MSPLGGGSAKGRQKVEGVGNVNRLPEGNVELSRSLMRALRHTGISLIYQDLSLRVVWAQNVPPCWSDQDLAGMTDFEFLPDGEAVRVVDAKKAVQQSGKPESLEIRVPDVDGVSWFEISVDA